jgi:hypothetical protein
MKPEYSFRLTLVCCGFVLLILATACSPKFVIQGQTIQGRVVHNETGMPITDAAVAIRWIGAQDHRDTGKSTTFKAAQDVSDDDGLFHIPIFENRDYALGVYKEGYVCWYNRDNFLKNEGITKKNLGHITQTPVLENGMAIRLTPFKDSYSLQHHAGFTVLVAGECTDTNSGPFNRAIRSEHKLWRDNLRNRYRKLFSKMNIRRMEPSGL